METRKIKFNLELRILLVFLFVIMIVGIISAESYSYDINEEGDVSYSSENPDYDLESLEKNERDNIVSLAEFASKTVQNEGDIGSIVYDDKLQKITLLDDKGEELIVVPKGVDFRIDDNQYTFTGTSEEVVIGYEFISTFAGFDPRYGEFVGQTSDYITIKIPETERKLINYKGEDYDLSENAELVISEENGLTNIKLEGGGSIYSSKISLRDINNAEIRINEDGEIAYAKFYSPNGGSYNLRYNRQTFFFHVSEEGGSVFFDPENRIVKGDSVTLTLKFDNKNPTASGKYSVHLDETGNVIRIDFEEGIFDADQSGRLLGSFFSKDKKFSVFLNGIDIRDFEGNAISIDDGGKVRIKGLIDGINLKRVNYEGVNSDTYTEYYYDGKEGEEGDEPYFDVIEGEANIDNGYHLVNVKDGKSRLKVKLGDREDPQGFRVSSHETDQTTEVLIDEDSETFLVTAYDSSGNEQGFAVEIPLNLLSNELSIPALNLKTLFEKSEQSIEERIRRAEEIIRSGKDDNGQLLSAEEMDGVRLSKVILENQLGRLKNDPPDKSIERMESFLRDNPDISIQTKAASQNILGELYSEKLKSNIENVPIGYSAEYSVKGYIDGFVYDEKKILEFKVENGKVIAIRNRGTNNWASLSLNFDRFEEELKAGYGKLDIESLYRDPSLANLQKLTKDMQLERTGILIDDKSFEFQFGEDYEKAKEYFSQARDNYLEEYHKTQDENLKKMFLEQSRLAELNNFKTQLLFDEKNIQDLSRFLDNSKGIESVISEVRRIIAMDNYNKNPKENVKSTLFELSSISESVPNQDVSQNLMEYRLSLINGRERILRNEVDVAKEEKSGVLGEEGFGEYTFRAFQTISQGARESIFGLYGVTETRQAAIEEKLITANSRIVGFDGLRTLVQNDIDIVDYMQEGNENYFRSLGRTMRSFSHDKYLSAEEFETYAREYASRIDGFNPSNQNHMSRLISALEKRMNDNNGKSVARLAVRDVMDAAARMSVIRKTVHEDPAAYYIATNGREQRSTGVSYLGNEDLNNAFSSERMGESIERTWYEGVLTGTGNFALLALVGGGASSLVARTAANVGGRTGAVINIARTSLAPAESLATRLLGQSSPKIAALLGFSGEATLGTGLSSTLHAIDPRLSVAYDMISVFGGSTTASKFNADQIKISRVDGQLFAHVDDNMEDFRKQLGSSEIQVGGQSVKIDTPSLEGPVATSTLGEYIEGIGDISRIADENLASVSKTSFQRLSEMDSTSIQEQLASRKFPEDLSNEIMTWNNKERIRFAKDKLSIELTEDQLKQIHLPGLSIAQKARIARQNFKFTEEQTRKLMGSGIFGGETTALISEVNPVTVQGRKVVTPEGQGVFLSSDGETARVLTIDESLASTVREYPMSSLSALAEPTNARAVYDDIPELFQDNDVNSILRELGESLPPGTTEDLPERLSDYAYNSLRSRMQKLGWFEPIDPLKNLGKTATILKHGIEAPRTEFAYHGTSSNFLESVIRNGLDNKLSGTVNQGVMGKRAVTYSGELDFARSFTKSTTESVGGNPMILRWKVDEWDGLNQRDIFMSDVGGSDIPVPSKLLEFSTDNGKTWKRATYGVGDKIEVTRRVGPGTQKETVEIVKDNAERYVTTINGQRYVASTASQLEKQLENVGAVRDVEPIRSRRSSKYPDQVIKTPVDTRGLGTYIGKRHTNLPGYTDADTSLKRRIGEARTLFPNIRSQNDLKDLVTIIDNTVNGENFVMREFIDPDTSDHLRIESLASRYYTVIEIPDVDKPRFGDKIEILIKEKKPLTDEYGSYFNGYSVSTAYPLTSSGDPGMQWGDYSRFHTINLFIILLKRNIYSLLRLEDY